MAENFDLIFGQSASSQYVWNDSDYQNGWGTVGSTPPTAEQFDALQRRNDKKAQELNRALTPLVNQNTASNRQPLTAYALKDIRYYNGLPVGWYLECSTAGTSGSGDITLPTPLVENATIADGAVVWKVRNITQYENELGNKADRSLSNLTEAGKSFSFPSETYVDCGITAPGQSYTTPANGYILCEGYPTDNSYYIYFNSTNAISAGGTYYSSTINMPSRPTRVILPVSKNDVIGFAFNNFAISRARFYYAQGEV